MSLAAQFRKLHAGTEVLILPNPWDMGSAALFKALGAKALATTSNGYAYSLGQLDGSVTRDQNLVHAAEMQKLSGLPVNADFENGYGDRPDDVAETIRLAMDHGIAGGSIEDYSMNPEKPIYDFSLALERIQAAKETIEAHQNDFVLVARSENYLHGIINVEDTLARLKAFEEAGADVLYAPGVTKPEELKYLCNNLRRPVNIVAEGTKGLTVLQAKELGVRRISLGSALACNAYGYAIKALQEILNTGKFTLTEQGADYRDVDTILTGE